MCHRCKVKADSVVMAVHFNFFLRQVSAVVGNDAMWDAESNHNVFENFRAVLPSSFLMGLASTHFMNLSTTTKRCLNPKGAIFSGPTMSSPQTAKGQVIGMVCSAVVGMWVCSEYLWQPWQSSMILSASALAIGQ
jgi:ribulose 1,5-bisphosphate synthetase/thiazole synthase